MRIEIQLVLPGMKSSFFRRSVLRPRLWWVLVIPIAFFQTRTIFCSPLSTRQPYGLLSSGGSKQVLMLENLLARIPFLIDHYGVFGFNVSPATYHYVKVVATACLVLGGTDLARVLFFRRKKEMPSPEVGSSRACLQNP